MATDLANEAASLTMSASPIEHQTSASSQLLRTIGTSIEPSALRVLNTAEPLEIILLQIDMRTLLLSQRVNRFFQSVIQGSSKLQQALFFQLGSSTAPNDEQQRGHTSFQSGLNPLLDSEQEADWSKDMPSTAFDMLVKYVDLRVTFDETGEELHYLTAPSGSLLSRIWLSPVEAREGSVRWELNITPLARGRMEEVAPSADPHERRFWQEGASWKRMYLCASPYMAAWKLDIWAKWDTIGVVTEEPATIGELLLLKGART